METDSCEPRRGWGELLWETEHLGPALAEPSQEGRGRGGLSFLRSDLQPSCCSVRPSRPCPSSTPLPSSLITPAASIKCG